MPGRPGGPPPAPRAPLTLPLLGRHPTQRRATLKPAASAEMAGAMAGLRGGGGSGWLPGSVMGPGERAGDEKWAAMLQEGMPSGQLWWTRTKPLTGLAPTAQDMHQS